MKKICSILAVSLWMLAVVFLGTPLNAEAENVTSSTLGDNGKIQWTYDADTKTLTMTGEDTGKLREGSNSVFKGICPDVELIIVKNCKLYDCDSLFAYLDKVQSITFDNFDTSQCTDMSNMFSDCVSLTNLDVSNFDTSQVTNMHSMFGGCRGLTALDVSKFDTSKVTDMGMMFWGCQGLKNLDVNGLDISSVTDVQGMFSYCSNVEKLDVSNFNTSNVTNMYSMFSCCWTLTGLDVSGFETSKVEDMRLMFAGCTGLNGLDVSGFNTTSVNKMGNMFWKCYNLTSIDLSNFTFANVSDCCDLFAECNNLITIKAPREMNTEQIINLPFTFVDSKNNKTRVITKDFCNEMLISELGAFVERMYTVALNRASESSGVEFWVGELKSNQDGARLAQGFLLGDEFKGKGYSDSKYIEVLYATFFNRTADEGGLNHWSNQLASGIGREQVLAGFVNSNEFFELCAEYGISRGYMNGDGSTMNPGIFRFTERLYTKVLKRAGEKDGMEFWAVEIANKTRTPEMAAQSFFASDEYKNKNTSDEVYIKDLYATFFDREADTAGLNYWIGEMQNGKTREIVLSDFAYSAEFKEIMSNFGL